MSAERSTASAARWEEITPHDTAATAVITSCRALVPALTGTVQLENNHGDDEAIPCVAGVPIPVTIKRGEDEGWIRVKATGSTVGQTVVRLYD